MKENGENKVNGVFGGATWENASSNDKGWTTTGNKKTVNWETTETTDDKSSEWTTGGDSENGNWKTTENTGESVFTKVDAENLPTKQNIWSKIRNFLFSEIDLTTPIKIELTPYQQKVEDEINEFLHQEISFKGFWNIITGKK